MNIVVLSGRVGKTPEVRNTPTGQKAVMFSIAIDRKDKSGNKITDWFSCTTWGSTADFVEKYVKSGSAVEVSGSLQTRSWETDDGQKKTIYFVLVDKVNFSVGNTKKEEQTEEMPFET